VLVNNSDKPLLLLAGEIVTGGKQDRVIAKDRMCQPAAEPIDLGVFCIEPGRWTRARPPSARRPRRPRTASWCSQACGAGHGRQDQQEVWNSVRGSISQMALASAPSASVAMDGGSGAGYARSMGTTSYARAMERQLDQRQVDEAGGSGDEGAEQVIAQLRKEGAIGVWCRARRDCVGRPVCRHRLAEPLLTKLVRSYAAESLTEGGSHAAPTVADAQHFLDAPS